MDKEDFQSQRQQQLKEAHIIAFEDGKYKGLLKRENTNLKLVLNEIKEYVNSDKFLGRLCEPRVNNKGETHFDLIREDILQIINKLGDEK